MIHCASFYTSLRVCSCLDCCLSSSCGRAAGTTAESRARPFGPISAVTLIPLAASIALTLVAAAARVPLCCGRRGDADDTVLGLLRARRIETPVAAGDAGGGNGDCDVGSGDARDE